jgi:hypothetical protein
MWKVATVGLGVLNVILAVVAIRAHKSSAGAVSIAPTTGEVRPDTRGAQELATKQIVLGSKVVAEAAKEGQLGPLRAQARAETKKLRVA